MSSGSVVSLFVTVFPVFIVQNVEMTLISTFCHRFSDFRETKCETASAVDVWAKEFRATK
jgi:hypothetical protein